MTTVGVRRGATGLTLLGLAGLVGLYWLSFFWVSTEATQGVVQRIFYVHVPAAWTAFLAIGISALCSAVYLWLRDDRLDRAAMCAAEGGIVLATIVLTTRAANGARTADSSAIVEAVRTAPSAWTTAPLACSYCMRAMSSSRSEAAFSV